MSQKRPWRGLSTEDAWTRGVFWGACTILCIVWQFGHTSTQQSYLKGPWGPMWEQCETLLHTLNTHTHTLAFTCILDSLHQHYTLIDGRRWWMTRVPDFWSVVCAGGRQDGCHCSNNKFTQKSIRRGQGPSIKAARHTESEVGCCTWFVWARLALNHRSNMRTFNLHMFFPVSPPYIRGS